MKKSKNLIHTDLLLQATNAIMSDESTPPTDAKADLDTLVQYIVVRKDLTKVGICAIGS